jgi:hypothetical protein
MADFANRVRTFRKASSTAFSPVSPNSWKCGFGSATGRKRGSR